MRSFEPEVTPAEEPEVSTDRRRPTIDVVDSQIHARVRMDRTVASMDAVGVEAAVIDIWPPAKSVDHRGVAHFDHTFVEDAMIEYPGRFSYVARVDPDDPEMDDVMAKIAENPAAVCVRTHDLNRIEAGGEDAMLSAAARYKIPVMISCFGHHEALAKCVRRFEDVQFIIDHAGMPYRYPGGTIPEFPEPASFHIDQLLQHAALPNVAVKWTCAPRLSHEDFPYRDVTEQLIRTIDAYGVERVMWGSDYTVSRNNHSYAEALFCVLHTDMLSKDDKEWVLGKSSRQILRWPISSHSGG